MAIGHFERGIIPRVILFTLTAPFNIQFSPLLRAIVFSSLRRERMKKKFMAFGTFSGLLENRVVIRIKGDGRGEGKSAELISYNYEYIYKFTALYGLCIMSATVSFFDDCRFQLF